jgi:hypothetical protein
MRKGALDFIQPLIAPKFRLIVLVWSIYPDEFAEFMMDVPDGRQQMGSSVGLRQRLGQSETPAPE